MAACTRSTPCDLPFIGQAGVPSLDQLAGLLSGGLAQQSGGAVQLSTVDVGFVDLIGIEYAGPGTNPAPLWEAGWGPDYPDPSDYVGTGYLADTAYTYPDSVGESLLAPAFLQSTYPGGRCLTGVDGQMNESDVWGYAHMAESLGGIPSACQGWAYEALNLEVKIAAPLPAGPDRVLAYNTVEQIANGLCLYIYWGQANIVNTVAPWINTATINTNIMVYGGGGWDFSALGGNGVVG
jgi:hypothetical protein